jgi:hypothetical protein
MTRDEFIAMVESTFPGAMVVEDDLGEIVISTGLEYDNVGRVIPVPGL